MRNALISILFLLVSSSLRAGDTVRSEHTRITFGAEWNYVGSFYCSIHHNFYSEVGYRVDLKNNISDYTSNADLYLHCGYNLNDRWNISLYAGIAGVSDINRIVPLSLRATRYFRPDGNGDRWFTFIDGGSGITLTGHPQAAASGKIGCGYRVSLSNASKLDFLFAFRTTLTHPEIEFDGFSVPLDKINRNNAYVCAFSAGISLTL